MMDKYIKNHQQIYLLKCAEFRHEEQEEVMREKTMKRGHLLLTLLAFVSLMWLGTIHANAATVKAKVDVKKFYGMAEQVLQEINRQRRSNGLSDLKMDANLTEAAMNIALQAQGGSATVSNPEIYNDKYTVDGAFELGDIDGYDVYKDNLWKESNNGKKKALEQIKKVGGYCYGDSNIASTIGIGIIATDAPQGIPRELNYGGFCNVTYCFVSNWIAYDGTSYKAYVNNGKTVRTQMDLYINPSDTYLIINANEDCLTPKYVYDVIKKGETRKAHPAVWQYPVAAGHIYKDSGHFKCKLSNTGATWSSSNPSIVSVDSNGNITAKKCGIATVTVKVGNLQAAKKYVVSDIIGMDTDTLLYLPNWKSKSDIPKEYTGNCYAGGYALEVKNGRITWSKNMKTNKITRPGSKKSTAKIKKLKESYYKITSKSKKTVLYVKPVKKDIISVTIPSSIKLNGKRYKVTGIAANAFKNCKKLKKITIGINVNNIGKKAFYGCSNLKTIKIKTSKLVNRRIGKQAFKGINKKAVIKVPRKQLKAYKKLLKTKGIGRKVKIKK